MSSGEPTTRLIADNVKLGKNVKIYAFTNLYGCELGDDVKVGTFVEIQKGARIGNRCKISSHSFLCEGVVLEEEVFIGHGVMFTNDRLPRATAADGKLQTEADWHCESTLIKKGHQSAPERPSCVESPWESGQLWEPAAW